MSLTLRLPLTYLLVTLGGLLLLGGGFITLAGQYTAQQGQRALETQAAIYSDYLAALASNTADLQALATSSAISGVLPADVTVRIFSVNGTLLSNSAGLGPFPSRPVLDLTSSPLPLPISQVANRRYIARAIPGNNGPIGIVELSHSTIAEQQFQRGLYTLLIQSTLLAALGMVGISLLVARPIVAPIVRLTRHAEELAQGKVAPDGQFTLALARPRWWQRTLIRWPAPTERSRDEIVLLARSLSQMAGQLQARIAEAEQERSRLHLVLSSISEGVVALDAQETLIFANPAATTLLAAPNPAAIPACLAALQVPLHPPAPLDQELQLEERYLIVSVNPVGHNPAPSDSPQQHPAVVLVLRDITRLKELEQARTRFLRSVSHDLRTPLTAIRGMLENLHDSAPPQQQPTFRTLEEESARLTRLVDELLNPSTSGALLLGERRRIDLGLLTGELCSLQQGRARRAGITLSCRVAAELPPVYGDRDRIKQAVLNLLDNAIHVTPPGGMVLVTVERAGPLALRVQVADDGPGVPTEWRERIWERGVRGVDLGQSQHQSGAGLGLAIVREIASAHGGRAWVEDNQPQGARFVLEFPLTSTA